MHVEGSNLVDDNDAIEVSARQRFADIGDFDFGFIVDSIKNLGIPNQPYESPATDDGTNPYWIGKNVNSFIYSRINEGAIVNQVTWTVRKNGVYTDYQSPELTVLPGNTTSYNLKY